MQQVYIVCDHCGKKQEKDSYFEVRGNVYISKGDGKDFMGLVGNNFVDSLLEPQQPFTSYVKSNHFCKECLTKMIEDPDNFCGKKIIKNGA